MIKLFTRNVKMFFRNIIITFSIKLYLIFKFTIILDIVSYFGGPVFVKLFQSFFNLRHVNNDNDMEGTIGSIHFNNDLVTKKLHKNIKNNFVLSLQYFEQFLNFNKYKYPFVYNDFYQHNISQLNLSLEAQNSFKLTKIFTDIHNVEIIKIYQYQNNFHISKKINAFDAQVVITIYPNFIKQIIYTLYLSYLLMIVSNFFHCDWHFGNFMIDISANKDITLYILDTGLMGSFDKKIHDRIISMILTDFLFPKRYNVIKFLLFCNTNKDANIDKFINSTKKCQNKYYDDISNILINASEYDLKFPIMILYMFQGILFINKLCYDHDVTFKELNEYSKKNNFHIKIKEIIKNKK